MVVYSAVIWLLLTRMSCGALYNAAHQIKATQSSTAHGGLASRAIDGNTDGNWGGATCTHTDCSGLQWIEIDLGQVHQIDHVSVWGRTDCCSERLLGAKLKIGGNICGTLKNMGKAGGPDNVTCSEELRRGQRVRVEQMGTCLTVCEIQVWVNDTATGAEDEELSTVGYVGEMGTQYTNVAYNKQATQSSTGWGGVASRAVDGFVKLSWNSGSCTHTLATTTEYWEVDLGRSYQIDHVLVYGRNDRHTERLQGAKLLVGGNECGTLTNMGKNPEGNADKISCYSKDLSKGRVVRIELFKNYLTLCEVQVMVKNEELGEEPATAESLGQYIENEGEVLVNIAVRGNATQSSTWSEKYLPGNAVDGISQQNLGAGSCTHTGRNEQDNWWRLDLGRVYNISEIRVYGRTDGGTERLKDGKVFIGSNVCGTMTDNKKKTGYYDSVKCPGYNVGRVVTVRTVGALYLTLCELQVLVTPDNAKEDEAELSTAPAHGLELEMNGTSYFNVAHNKPVTQSSTGWGGIASRAVDGYPAKLSWDSGSCTHTLNSGTQYWEVDLGRVYDIDHIQVNGRTDRHQTRINGARVYIGRHLCGTLTYHGTTPHNITCTESGHNKGRIVKIDLLNDYLSLCEVQVMVRADRLDEEQSTVMPRYSNVAIGKPTSQSSTAHGGVSDRAVDGWPDKLNWRWGSCTHTNHGDLEWWQVDLEAVYTIDNIVIKGRGDCCQERMENAIVLLDGKTVTGLSYYSQQTHWGVKVGNREGRVVRITQQGVLTVCEVLVLVDNYYEETDTEGEEGEEGTALALVGRMSSSSVGYGATPDLAMDGNTEANFYRGSCMMTGVAQGDAWFKVELDAIKKIGVVKVYPRLDSHKESSIDSAVVRVGEHYCGQISFSDSQHYTVDCEGVEADSITVSKLGTLCICEIEIYQSQD